MTARGYDDFIDAFVNLLDEARRLDLKEGREVVSALHVLCNWSTHMQFDTATRDIVNAAGPLMWLNTWDNE